MNDITLDERLEADTFPVTELPLCRLLLMNDTRFTWVILVPRQPGASEVFDLDEQSQQQLWREASALGAVMKDAFEGDKINIAALGNVVSQLHVHVIVRHKNDAAWPGPVWGLGNAEPYTPDQQASVRAQLLAEIERLNLT
ncbi:MAG: HIT domain-containing protein [Pseudomonadota bacterium]